MKKLLLILLCLPIIGFASFPIDTKISKNKCDIIVLKSGDEISANIIEITPYTIKYKNCQQNKPIISVSKKEVVMIKYSDGKNEIIKSPKVVHTPGNWIKWILLGIIGFIAIMALVTLLVSGPGGLSSDY